MAGRATSTTVTAGDRWWRRNRLVTPLLLAGIALITGACGDDPPEQTIEERLSAIEGRTLTAGEVADLLAVGDALCRLDDPVLEQIWLRLDDDQLDFQDFVFEERCPERSVLYAGHTGRYVTDEAIQSGVSTSTTRPPTTRPPTTTTPSTNSSSSSSSTPSGPSSSSASSTSSTPSSSSSIPSTATSSGSTATTAGTTDSGPPSTDTGEGG